MNKEQPFKATKKPVTIEAIQLTDESMTECIKFIDRQVSIVAEVDKGITIKTLEGDLLAGFGDYIIKGVKGEFYPCKADVFEKTYDFDGNDSGVYSARQQCS